MTDSLKSGPRYRFEPDALMARLPRPRGRLTPMAKLGPYTWLRVGGPAEVLFSPVDAEDLAHFLANTSSSIPITPIGVGSNLIVRDGGVPGVVIRLGPAFGKIEAEQGSSRIRAGAAALDARVAEAAAEAGIAGLEFLRGVPGAIGGALRMNAGAYGRYTADILVEAEAVSLDGRRLTLSPQEMGFSYRDSRPRELIYTGALFEGEAGDPAEVRARMEALLAKRAESQPVKDRTAGSTFRNPAGYSSTGAADDPMTLKAWTLIDKAGCRGLKRGGAMMSEMHSNFLTNANEATAADLEDLGEEVRARVLEATGQTLEWEVRRIGLRREQVEGAET